LLVLTVAVALAPAGPGGPVPEQALAHIITPTGTPGPPMFHVEIDADARNGDGPCDPVDVSAEVGGRHEVAVCITNAPDSVSAFRFRLVYDSAVDDCVEEECPPESPDWCVDANPDLNDGLTLGSGSPTDPDLGDGWRCPWEGSHIGSAYPVCDDSNTAEVDAALMCLTPFPLCTSPLNADPWPLAAVAFDAASPGVDSLGLKDVELFACDVSWLGSCNFDSPRPQEVPCFGATLNVQEWTPTPSPTPTPTATSTPGGAVGGMAEPPDIESEAAASGPGASVAGAAAVAMGAALLAAAGGWYARRRRRAG
jgi:hypothetical protein